MTNKIPANSPAWPAIPFSGNPLDRAANFRREADWVDQQRRKASTRLLPLNALKAHIAFGDEPGIGWLSGIEAVDLLDAPGDLVFLGLRDGVAHFARDVADFKALPGHRFMEVRMITPQRAEGEAAILAQARSLVDWHKRHGYCAVCGHRTALREAGYMRQCSNQECNAQHFPRTDPVVIMLVEDGPDRCLLGRGRQFATGAFSALAGFMEPGESLEEAVRREVQEEAGIRVGAVRYVASQPWPFPSSLMIGCIGTALDDAISVDDKELESVRWFSRAEVEEMMANWNNNEAPFRAPGPIAIAHHIIKRWLGGA